MTRRSNIYRLLMLLLVCCAIEAIGYTAVWLHSRQKDVLSNKSYFLIRAMLMGSQDPERFPRYLSLPYMGFVPYPGYKRHGVIQHNKDGYRGDLIPMERDGKYRILCLGGSTTYGYGVDTPAQTYPAQLCRLLSDSLRGDSLFSKKYTGVEVLNGGLEGGTSAEELQQYLFKYRYYKPDVVILHSGINDAALVAMAIPDFQADYTHVRRINYHLEPLRQPARFLMHSYFFSYLAIRLFYEDFSQVEYFESDRKTFCKWYQPAIDSVMARRENLYYPFYRNVKSLATETINDSASLVIMPNATNRNFMSARYAAICDLNTELSRRVAADVGAVYVPFTFQSIDSTLWMDDCHLLAPGEVLKARLLVPSMLATIRQKYRTH